MAQALDPETPLGEMRLIGEYVARTYGDATIFLRLRLGQLEPGPGAGDLSESERRTYNVYRRWADAVIVRPSELILIEAKMRAEPGVVAQLDLYARLLPYTPELRPYLNRPLVKELLVAIEDPVVSMLAREQGIRVSVYLPPWFGAWAAHRRRRSHAPRRTGGLPT